jgi:basic membrane protein A
VNTAWGDVLHTNLPNAPHGEGDYLVCRVGEDGQPDLSDVWVVNGVQFPSNYDQSHRVVERNVLVLVPNPNDGSYFEAAVNGAKELEVTYPGTTVDVIGMGEISVADGMPTEEEELEFYKDYFIDGCESGKYDLIITGGGECNAAMLYAAQQYPDQMFFSFDLQYVEGTAWENQDFPNVYGLMYKSEDLGYLAGYVACQITTSDMPNANADKKVGVIVGMDVAGLNDYIGSFCQVCQENGVSVYIDYTGGFSADSASLVAEKAKAMYDDGVDVIWQVSGSAGKGVFTAAAEAGRYAMGVDCDQTLTVEDEGEKATIVTSFYQNYAYAIEKAFAALVDGAFPGGTHPTVGLAEGYAGYADNQQFESLVPQAVRESVDALYATMADGNTQIFKVSDDPEGWETMKAAVAP